MAGASSGAKTERPGPTLLTPAPIRRPRRAKAAAPRQQLAHQQLDCDLMGLLKDPAAEMIQLARPSRTMRAAGPGSEGGVTDRKGKSPNSSR